jgi:hypothetical protein
VQIGKGKCLILKYVICTCLTVLANIIYQASKQVWQVWRASQFLFVQLVILTK